MVKKSKLDGKKVNYYKNFVLRQVIAFSKDQIDKGQAFTVNSKWVVKFMENFSTLYSAAESILPENSDLNNTKIAAILELACLFTKPIEYFNDSRSNTSKRNASVILGFSLGQTFLHETNIGKELQINSDLKKVVLNHMHSMLHYSKALSLKEYPLYFNLNWWHSFDLLQNK